MFAPSQRQSFSPANSVFKFFQVDITGIVRMTSYLDLTSLTLDEFQRLSGNQYLINQSLRSL